jgi:hypothetical protein
MMWENKNISKKIVSKCHFRFFRFFRFFIRTTIKTTFYKKFIKSGKTGKKGKKGKKGKHIYLKCFFSSYYKTLPYMI